MLSLKNFLAKNRDARRIFGRRELEIMQRQLDGLPLKQSERNRLSRDIRPKLEFIREIAQFKDEFRLEKGQENKAIIEKAVDVILNDALGREAMAILLFGSFADKTFTGRSDIDVCVVFGRDVSLKEATKFRIRVLGELPEKADVQVFNALPQKVKKEVARSHRVLYSAQDYDNVGFTMNHIKDDDYFVRMRKVFGAAA